MSIAPLTKDQAIVISAYTGVLICSFADMHEECEKRLGTPIFTHEFANREMVERIGAAFKADFLALRPVECAP